MQGDDQTNGDQTTSAGSAPTNPVQHRKFGSPFSSTATNDMLVRVPTTSHPNATWKDLPQPVGPAPYHLKLEDVLHPDSIAAINKAGKLVFHTVGDTGGIKNPNYQIDVTNQMIADLETTDPAARPAFLYHLGDVVYYYGKAQDYAAQFYEPYNLYTLPIFAIPGNHDGDLDPTDSAQTKSLEAFVTNFCAETPHITQDAGDIHQDAMTQPNVYWTLEAPFVTFIGLYTNVPAGGDIHQDQYDWFVNELKTAPRDKALIVSMHHPIYSADDVHVGSDNMGTIFEKAIEEAGRVPHAVLAGHVHNYQRFMHNINGQNVLFIVAGAGGYWNLHHVRKDPAGNKVQTPYQIPGTDVTLASYCDTNHGYLQLEITSQKTLTGKYISVPGLKDPHDAQPTVLDTFILNLP
jgi:acid phosphatase type 7